MANRWLNQFGQTFEKTVVTIYARVSFGASGAPTLVTTATSPAQGNSKGCASIAQNGTGDYTLTLSDSWVKLLAFSGSWDTSGASAAAPLGPIVYSIANSVTTQAGGTFRFKTGDYVNGAAANPASGEVLLLKLELSNSTAY